MLNEIYTRCILWKACSQIHYDWTINQDGLKLTKLANHFGHRVKCLKKGGENSSLKI